MKTERALDGISDLAGHGHDVVTFWNEATELMAPIVPHYMGTCWYTLDPASLLMTSHFNPAMPEIPREWMELEYYEDDVHDIANVARSEAGISTSSPLRRRVSGRWRAGRSSSARRAIRRVPTRQGYSCSRTGVWSSPRP